MSSINVKLEGVSKTRLLVPKENESHDSRNKKAHIEIHKVSKRYYIYLVSPTLILIREPHVAIIPSENRLPP